MLAECMFWRQKVFYWHCKYNKTNLCVSSKPQLTAQICCLEKFLPLLSGAYNSATSLSLFQVGLDTWSVWTVTSDCISNSTTFWDSGQEIVSLAQINLKQNGTNNKHRSGKGVLFGIVLSRLETPTLDLTQTTLCWASEIHTHRYRERDLYGLNVLARSIGKWLANIHTRLLVPLFFSSFLLKPSYV